MKTFARITVAVGIFSICAAEETEFSSSEALTAKKVYEAALKNAEIRYTKELGDALEVAMDKGDLAEATRIHSALKRMNSSASGVVKLPNNDKELRAYLEGTTWKFPDGKMITLESSGKVRKSFGKTRPGWFVENMLLTFDEGGTFEFSNNFRNLTSNPRGKHYVGVAELVKSE